MRAWACCGRLRQPHRLPPCGSHGTRWPAAHLAAGSLARLWPDAPPAYEPEGGKREQCQVLFGGKSASPSEKANHMGVAAKES